MDIVIAFGGDSEMERYVCNVRSAAEASFVAEGGDLIISILIDEYSDIIV